MAARTVDRAVTDRAGWRLELSGEALSSFRPDTRQIDQMVGRVRRRRERTAQPPLALCRDLPDQARRRIA